MIALDLYWLTNHDWWYWEEDTMAKRLKPDAPPEAKESYERYIEQCKSKRGIS